MTNTTNTSANTERDAKQKAIQSVADLDMRDYFAAAWLQGAAADPNVRNWRYDAGKHAVTAYAVADAMLCAREAA